MITDQTTLHYGTLLLLGPDTPTGIRNHWPFLNSHFKLHFSIQFAFFLLDPDSPTGIRILATAQIQILISSALLFPLVDKFWQINNCDRENKIKRL